MLRFCSHSSISKHHLSQESLQNTDSVRMTSHQRLYSSVIVNVSYRLLNALLLRLGFVTYAISFLTLSPLAGEDLSNQ